MKNWERKKRVTDAAHNVLTGTAANVLTALAMTRVMHNALARYTTGYFLFSSPIPQSQYKL